MATYSWGANTNDTYRRARLTFSLTETATGASWSAAVIDNNINYGGYSETAGSWQVVIARTAVASASGKSYDFGSGQISSPYFPISDNGFISLNPGIYTAKATFSGGTTTVATATIPEFGFTITAPAPTTYTVTYSNSNGSNNTTTETVTSGSTGTFPNPGTYTGRSFNGWYDSSTGSYYSAGTSTPAITGAKTFTASWTLLSYAISYAANGGTGTMSNTTWNYGSNGTVASNGFTRTGYTFSGWKNPDGLNIPVGTLYAQSVSLTAQWVANTFSVSYNGNGSTSGSTSNTTWTTPSTSGTVNANGFLRTNYSFVNWNTSSNGSGTSYAPGSTINTSGTILYAQWLLATITPVFTDTTMTSPATLNVAYSDGVIATNATSYSIFSGSLPSGLSLNTSTGAITGTPTTQGTYNFVIRATSSTSTSVNTGTLTVTVYPPGKRPSTSTRLTTAKRFIGIGASTTNAQGTTISADANGYVNLSRMMVYKDGQWTHISNI